MTLAELLRARGHTVEVAHDAVRALDVVRQFRPSVALLDLGLPVTDGYELARLLRQQTGLGRLRLVAMTGSVRPSDVARARRAGFSEHFAKPFDVDSLVASVERCRQES
jgi:CheY-like chemotaxis protein